MQNLLLFFCAERCPDLFQTGVHIRQKFFEIMEDCGRFPDKHAAVPRITAGCQIAFRRFQIRFFHKFFYLAPYFSSLSHAADITIAGRGKRRMNPDRHKRVRLFHCTNRFLHHAGVFRLIADISVRRKNAHHAVTVFMQNFHRRITDTRCCIARRRLCQNMICRNSACCALLHHFCLRLIGHNKNVLLIHQVMLSVDRLVNQNIFAGQV